MQLQDLLNAGGPNMGAPMLRASVTTEQLTAALTKSFEAANAKALTYQQSGSATSGITAYSLEGPAKLFYPVLTPLRNMLPRKTGGEGLQAAWRAVTGINSGAISAAVSEGNRGGVISVTTKDYVAAFRGIGFEDNSSFEAFYAGRGFDDTRQLAAQAGLQSLMIAEERMILQGNGTLQLGTTPTPSLSAATTGGSLATQTLSVIAVALTAYGYNYCGGSVATGITQTYTRTNADGSQDTINAGTAQKSTNATVSVTGSTGSALATVGAVRGAAAYAWFWGAAGSEVLGAITTVPKVAITATATGTQTAASLAATDYSVNSLEFSGLITLALTSGSGAYYADLGGAYLTADGNNGINEINVALKDRWDNYRLNPDTMWVSSQEAINITDRITTGKANGTMRFVADMKQGMFAGGVLATSYLNKFGLGGATDVKIRQHPYITPGTIVLTTENLPYPMANTPNVMQMMCRQDYYQIEWPIRSRKYEYGVYADEVLQLYFPPAISVITGIGNG